MDSKIILLNNPALHLGKSVFRGRLNPEDYVDMGLPSGTKWAASNLDLKEDSRLAPSPFQYECSFFSWGNVEGHNPMNDTNFEYDFGSINTAAPWYEGQPYGDTPGSTLAENIPTNIEFDAARALLGDPWRTPLSIDFQELVDNCIYIDEDGNEVDTTLSDKRVTVNGIVGIYLQSKINSARLFFAAAGNGAGTSWNNRGGNGLYWTATFGGSARYARSLHFLNNGVYPQGTNNRYFGAPIRAIMK